MIPNDKLVHFFVGAGIQLGLYHLAKAVGMTHEHAQLVGFIGSLGASMAKEAVWDAALGRGTPDFADFTFGVLGAGLGVAVLEVRW